MNLLYGDNKESRARRALSSWLKKEPSDGEREFAEGNDEALGFIGGYTARDEEIAAESFRTCLSVIGTGLMIILFCGVVYFMAVLIELAAKGGA
jgi:hypothetical protein